MFYQHHYLYHVRYESSYALVREVGVGVSVYMQMRVRLRGSGVLFDCRHMVSLSLHLSTLIWRHLYAHLPSLLPSLSFWTPGRLHLWIHSHDHHLCISIFHSVHRTLALILCTFMAYACLLALRLFCTLSLPIRGYRTLSAPFHTAFYLSWILFLRFSFFLFYLFVRFRSVVSRFVPPLFPYVIFVACAFRMPALSVQIEWV
jgi:hypothetical protein